MAPSAHNSDFTFTQGDTFIFGSWVCVADGAGSFQRYLAPAPEEKPSSTTLPQASVDELVENLGEISLSDPIRGHELESECYSGSTTTTWIETRELALEPSCDSDLPPQRLLFGLCNLGAVYQAALSKIQHQGELPELEYYSDSDEEKPLIVPALGLVIMSTLEGRFIYWLDQKPFDLATDDDSCLIACLEQLPYQEGTPLPTISEEGDTEIITSSSGSSSPQSTTLRGAHRARGRATLSRPTYSRAFPE